MTGELRRKEILSYIATASQPVSGLELSRRFSVSRQVIVQDIALLRACNCTIISTNRGYVLLRPSRRRRIFKVWHTDLNIHEELQTIVDCGGSVVDVFVNHKAYGVLAAPLPIHSRRDIETLMHNISTGKSSLLENTTSGYHFHTVEASCEATLDLIEEELRKKGFLAPVLEYEAHLLQGKNMEQPEK